MNEFTEQVLTAQIQEQEQIISSLKSSFELPKKTAQTMSSVASGSTGQFSFIYLETCRNTKAPFELKDLGVSART